jgi:hypothetical protein
MKELNITSKNDEAAFQAKTVRKLTILTAIEQIVELSSGSSLSDEFFGNAKRYIKYLSKRLSLTPMQAVLLSIFVDNSNESRIRMSDFTKHLGCRNIKIICLAGDMDELERRRFIRCRRTDDGQSWRVPFDVIKAFKRDEEYKPQPAVNLSCIELFDRINELFNQRRDRELSFEMFAEEIKALIEANQQLLFSIQLSRYSQASTNDIMLLLLFCRLFVENNDDNIGAHDFDDLYDNKYDYREAKMELFRGEHYWQQEGYIENSSSDGFLESESFKLTDKAKQELLSELNISNGKTIPVKGVINCDSIAVKQLYFNAGEQQHIEQLSSLLQPDNFKAIQERLLASGMRKGFACLFYGAPGTGKTETVYQLARQTGRDIIQVNIAEIKSCWVGESEKNIKSLFDNYRYAVKHSKNDVAPILLFNEADALINRRKEGSTAAVDKMENAMQNIILQEMETLEGILIATTNLTQNLDKAFERRFLYKIEFSKPNIEAKQAIWKSMISELTDDEARSLASRYEFSGGQIENIARKQMVDSILYGTKNKMEMLEIACENERIGKESKHKIGFL